MVRLGGAARGAVCAGDLRQPHSQRARRELGRHRRWRRRDERDAGQQHSAARIAQPEAQNVLANESKGLSQSQPKEVPKEEPKAIPIPARDAKQKGAHESAAPKKEPPKQVAKAEPDNQIPYGQGGPVSGPYGSFTSGATKGGFGFQGGQGDFGSRFAYYVDIVRRKVSDNWLKYEVDPRISDARRVYIYFEINRSGQPTNVRVEQSSGIPSLDQSAVRALQRIDTFGPLPSGYSGNYVAVEFWFDYRR